MSAFSLPLGLLLAGFALPAAAAPWQVLEAEQEGYQLRYAYQADDSQQYRFAVSCIVGNEGYNVILLTPEPWDDTASYAAEVPLTITFDGAARPDLQFFFANGAGFLTVAYRMENFEGELSQLLESLKSASRIELSYLDKTVSFSGEGSGAAIGAIDAACFQVP